MAVYVDSQVSFKIPRFNNSLASHRWAKRVTISLLSLFLLYVVGGFFGVPLILRHIVLAKMNDKLVGTMEVGHFRFNPFSWELKVEDFMGVTTEGEQAAAFSQFRVNLQPSSIFSDAYVVRELILEQPNCTLHVDESGQVNLASLFSLRDDAPVKKDSEPLVIPPLIIEHLEVRDAGFLLRVDTFEKPFKRELKDVSFVMKDLRTNAGHDNDYRFTLASAAGEELEVSGSLRLDPLSSVGSVSVKALNLADFSSFGSAVVDAEISSGVLDLYFDYRFLPLADEPELGVQNGSLSLQDFNLVKPGSDQLYHRINTLQLDGFFFDIDRQSARLESLSVDGASILLVRDQQGQLELIHKVASQPSASSVAGEGGDQADPEGGIQLGLVAADKDIGEAITEALKRIRKLVAKSRKAGAGAVAMTLQNFTINNTVVRIRDESVQPALNLEIKDITMTAGPFVTAEESPLEFDLAMNLGGSASGDLKVRGSLLPSQPFKSTRLELSADGVSMPSFAGYCVPVIGRAPTSGGVKAKLDYHMKNGLIEGVNGLEIRQMKFGPRVESSKAPHLPLGLAIAVLEDPDGVIVIDIPMSGDINHPKFSYGSMVSYAIHNVITKIATAPMSVLSGLFPHGDGAQQDFIEFEPGQASLPKGAAAMLGHLAKIMKARPGLVIHLTTSYSPKKDTSALGELHFEQKVAALMSKGEDREGAIKKLHKSLPKEERAAGFFPNRKEMEQADRKAFHVTEEDLRKLAEERAQAVSQVLVAEGEIKASRIEIKTPALSTSTRVTIGFDAQGD